MFEIIKTDATHKDFRALVVALDAYLEVTDGEDHAFYDQFNSIDTIKHVLVAYQDTVPVGCGAIKVFNKHAVEVKRMYTIPSARGKGVAKKILHDLEQWAFQLGYQKCVLETGVRQVEAIALYIKSGYIQTENYGQYKDVNDSVCFKKQLNKILT